MRTEAGFSPLFLGFASFHVSLVPLERGAARARGHWFVLVHRVSSVSSASVVRMLSEGEARQPARRRLRNSERIMPTANNVNSR